MAMIIIIRETPDNSMYPAACSVLSDALLEPSSFLEGSKTEAWCPHLDGGVD